MDNKKVVASVAGVAVLGILSYVGYKVFKEINTLDLGDIVWDNLDDVYHYRHPKKEGLGG